MSTLAGPSSPANSRRVTLKPTPGFCLKSVTTEAGFYVYASSSPSPSSSKQRQDAKLLEPDNIPSPKTLQIPKGVKVFLNIAWDSNVPPPPPADEAVVRRAMMGEDLDDAMGIGGDGAYYVPVVVSEPREDRDKAGKPSVVFDAVFNAALKSRCTKDPDFKLYIIELALEHVEEKAHILLSRQIGTPNIASKGKLDPRTVLIPTALLDAQQHSTAHKVVAASNSSKPLIEEVTSTSTVNKTGLEGKGPSTSSTGSSSLLTTSASTERKGATQAPPKSILKKNAKQPALTSTSRPALGDTSAPGAQVKKPLIEELPDTSASAGCNRSETETMAPIDLSVADFLPVPKWSWVKDDIDGGRIRIDIEVPKLTRALHNISALDIEARRLLLYVPKTYFLDINLDLPDAQIGKLRSMSIGGDSAKHENRKGSINNDTDSDENDHNNAKSKSELDVVDLRIRGHNAGETLRLKRQRDLDIDNARSEWRIGERRIVVWV